MECTKHRGTLLRPVYEDRPCSACGHTSQALRYYECVVADCGARYGEDGEPYQERKAKPTRPAPESRPIKM